MKCNSKNSKGFTLIELLIVLGLMGIVITMTFSFFFSNYRTFNKGDDQIEAQYQAGLAMDLITDTAINSAGIVSIINQSNSYKMVFKMVDIETLTNSQKEIIHKKTGDNKLFLGTTEYAQNIMEISVDLLPDGAKTISEAKEGDTVAKGMEITVKANVGNEVITLNNRVYFRNIQ